MAGKADLVNLFNLWRFSIDRINQSHQMKLDASKITYTHDGFARIFEPVPEDQIKQALNSSITRIIVVHEDSFEILFYDENYLHPCGEVEKLFGISLCEQYDQGYVSVLGYLGD